MRKIFGSITIRTKRQFQAFTGITPELFEKILPAFDQALEEQRIEEYRNRRKYRKRRPGGGRKSVLSTVEIKLFFILFYLKNYPTFDVLAGLFDLSISNAKGNVDKLLPILLRLEKKLEVLPHRHFIPRKDTRSDEGKENDQEGKNDKIQRVDIDATERRCRRPKHDRKQKNYYSGKKKAHTLKNTIISDRDRTGILVVGPTTSGRHHDYALFKKELNPDRPGLSRVDASFDSGFQGVKKDYPNFHAIHIPHKKPRKSQACPTPELTDKQKKENRFVSRLRIGVEHVIGDLKDFRILSDRFRNRTIKMADRAILAISGLCNLKNNYVVQ